MKLTNNAQRYGLISILLHWLMAISFIALYFVGDYMLELDYYDPLYRTLPHWHKSIGLMMAALLIVRLIWMYSHSRPRAASSEAPAIFDTLATLGHWSLYGLVIAIFISGYLISTATGQGIDVFDWFTFPALLPDDDQRADFAGDIHRFLADALMLLVVVHVIAALIHHFYWKDETFRRMLGLKPRA